MGPRSLAIAFAISVASLLCLPTSHGQSPKDAAAYEFCAHAAWPAAGSSRASELALAAISAEQILADDRSTAPSRALGVLNDAAKRAQTANDTLTVPGAYCAALGESLRRDETAGPVKSRLILRIAVGLSELEHDAHASARAAYRLSLAMEGESDVYLSTDRDRMRQLRARITEARSSGCVDALRGDTRDLLECAFLAADAAGDTRLSALAALRQWRSVSDLSEIAAKRPELRQRLLAVLDEAAGSPSQYSDLSMRVVEMLIDDGVANENNQLIAALERLGRSPATQPAALAFHAAMQAKINLRDGESAEARSSLRRAIAFESSKSLPDRLPEWFVMLAEADPANRTTHLRSAQRALEAVEPQMPRYDPLTGDSLYRLRTRSIFETIIDETMDLEQPADSFAIVRPLIESFRRAELESVFGEDCVPPLEPLDPAQLRDGEIILYPVQLTSRLEIFYATRELGRFDHLFSHHDQSRERTEQLADQFRRNTGRRTPSLEQWRLDSGELYELIITPLEQKLPGSFQSGPGGTVNTTLIISPGGALRAIPYAALMPLTGDYLISKARLTLAPSLSYVQTGGDLVSSQQNVSVLAAALTAETLLDEGSFGELSATKFEAQSAAGFGRARPLQKRAPLVDFTVEELREALATRKIDVLHLATHASFSGRGSQSFLVANDGTVSISSLKQMIGQNRAMGDQLRLLILSACESALGDDEASMGLAGAAVQSGAISAIASLWQVNDVSTQMLMTQFYEAYAEHPTGEALRRAQLAMLQLARLEHIDPKFASPYYWSAFTLIGGWR